MNTWETISKISSDFTGLSKAKMDKTTRIELDLGITGDDAVDFLELFVDTFSVEVSGFNISHFFGGEGFDPIGISVLVRKILKRPKPKRSEHELTLGDLEQWVKFGNWKELESQLEGL